MMRLMGFSGFNSTKGKEVDDPNANASGVFKKSVRTARQYMNRKGGFNRALPSEVTGVRQSKT
jgi:U4/U6.U5 tri-snRNP-associated protein 3